MVSLIEDQAGTGVEDTLNLCLPCSRRRRCLREVRHSHSDTKRALPAILPKECMVPIFSAASVNRVSISFVKGKFPCLINRDCDVVIGCDHCIGRPDVTIELYTSQPASRE